MSDSSKDFQVPQKVVEVMIDNIFRKNNVKRDEIKNKISDDQRQMIEQMINDLKQQVEQFKKSTDETNE